MFLSYWKRGLALGWLSWLLPFVFSFLIFPLKRIKDPLFEAAMALAVVATAAVLGGHYFRDAARIRVTEAAYLGLLWVAINLAMDYPMFAYGPMQMSAARYYSEIGAGYLLYPAFLAGAAWVFRSRPQTT
jgi:hypothetical protein